jgi:hypothetical protein
MKHSGDLHLAIVPVIDDVILHADRANAGAELGTETTHPGLFRQEVEAVDDLVDEARSITNTVQNVTNPRHVQTSVVKGSLIGAKRRRQRLSGASR